MTAPAAKLVPPPELWIGFGDFGDYVFHSPDKNRMVPADYVHHYVLAALVAAAGPDALRAWIDSHEAERAAGSDADHQRAVGPRAASPFTPGSSGDAHPPADDTDALIVEMREYADEQESRLMQRGYTALSRMREQCQSAEFICNSYATENQQLHDRMTAAEAEVEQAKKDRDSAYAIVEREGNRNDALNACKAEVARLTLILDDRIRLTHAAEAERDSLRAELEAAQKDAARYRFIGGTAFDAAIDAAIKAEEGK